MDVYEAVVRRRSIRRFKDAPVSYEVLEQCVDAARLAPTARNSQVLEYLIADEERLLPRVYDTITMWAGQPSAQSGPPTGHRPRAYIIVLINKTREAETGVSGRSTTYDIGLATENLILVALEQGIGSCVLLSFQENELRQVLNIPTRYEVGMVVALGYSDESPVVEVATSSINRWVDEHGVRHVPKRKLEDVLHRNKF